jgi:hypothetical protein
MAAKRYPEYSLATKVEEPKKERRITSRTMRPTMSTKATEESTAPAEESRETALPSLST